MLRIRARVSILVALVICGYSRSAGRFLQLKIGPAWPSSLQDSRKSTAWNATSNIRGF